MTDQDVKDADARKTKRAGGEVPDVRWDDSGMASTYANVVNATSSREEVTLFFGTNRTWNVSKAESLTISLSNRIILNPHAAKRLLMLLTAVLAEYERRFGKIVIGTRPDMPPED
jgi:hypothetical protein